jgi:hypothetical protein
MVLPMKTVQAAYDSLVAEAPSFGPGNGVGRIVLLPGDHDVQSGLVLRWDKTVELVGLRGGHGGPTPKSGARIVSSSSTVTEMILTGSLAHVTYGNRFRDLAFGINPAVNTALTAVIRAAANDHLDVQGCAADTLAWQAQHLDCAFIVQDPGGSAQDSAWARIRDNQCARVALYKASPGTNFNRSIIDGNVCFYNGPRPMVHLEGDWLAGTVSGNNLEGSATAVRCDAATADHNVFVGNAGESADATNPFYVINGAHQGSLFIGGHCTAGAGNGVWIQFGVSTFGNTVLGDFSVRGVTGYKRKFVDLSTYKSNTLVGTFGLLPKTREAAGMTRLADYHFASTPDDGTFGFVRDTTTNRTYLTARFAGAWRSVEMT